MRNTKNKIIVKNVYFKSVLFLATITAFCPKGPESNQNNSYKNAYVNQDEIRQANSQKAHFMSTTLSANQMPQLGREVRDINAIARGNQRAIDMTNQCSAVTPWGLPARAPMLQSSVQVNPINNANENTQYYYNGYEYTSDESNIDTDVDSNFTLGIAQDEDSNFTLNASETSQENQYAAMQREKEERIKAQLLAKRKKEEEREKAKLIPKREKRGIDLTKPTNSQNYKSSNQYQGRSNTKGNECESSCSA